MNQDKYDAHESMEMLTDENETTSTTSNNNNDTPILDGWNTPLTQTEDNESIMARMRDKIRNERVDPISELRELINAPTFIDEEVEDDLSTPRVYSGNNEIEDPSKELEELGILDESVSTEPEQNPDIEITKLDSDEQVNKPPTLQEDSLEAKDEPEVVKLELKEIVDDPRFDHNAPFEQDELDPEVQARADKDNAILEPSQEELDMFHPVEETDELPPEVVQQLAQDLKDKEPTDSSIPSELKDALNQMSNNNDEEVPMYDDEPDPVENNTSDEDKHIQDSLEDIPASTLVLPSLELDNTDDIERFEFNPINALTALVDINELTIYDDGEPSKTFLVSDLDEIKDNELPYARIIQANATQEEMERYMNSASPEALSEKASQLFSANSPKGRIMREGLELLNTTLLNTNSYPHKMYMAASQSTTPNVLEAKKNLEKAKVDAKERNPDKKWLFSKAIQVKDGDGVKVISDQFADKKLVFDKIADHGKKQIRGNNTAKVAAMLINGFRKINLFNSGFNVVIIAPTLQQLSKYYNIVYENSSQYGYDLGQLGCIPAGVEAKAALLDLWESCVIESNLIDYQEDNNLRRALSVLDIPVVAWAMASLMYPRGTDIEHICYNTYEVDGESKLCRHSEKVKISINDMRYNDWSKLSSEAVRFVDSKEPRSVEDCESYRATYLKDHGSSYAVHDDADGVWKAVFKIPSAYTNEETHRTYIANMLANLSSGTMEDKKEIENYIRTKYLMSLSPYIDSITYTDIKGQKTLDFNDPDSLESVLDQLQLLDGSSLPEKLMEYIGSKVITHICYSHYNCPVCNKPATGSVNGLIACDPEYSFFVWLTVRLHQ